MEKIPYKIYLSEKEMPTKWYNVRSDMKKKPAPLLNPGTKQPLTFEDMQPIFCDELIKQELDDDTKWFGSGFLPYVPSITFGSCRILRKGS